MVEGDTDIEVLVAGARESGHKDLAAAMEMMRDTFEEEWPDAAATDEAAQDLDLPFYEQDREVAFTLGFAFGAAIEQAFPEDGYETDDSDE